MIYKIYAMGSCIKRLVNEIACFQKRLVIFLIAIVDEGVRGVLSILRYETVYAARFPVGPKRFKCFIKTVRKLIKFKFS